MIGAKLHMINVRLSPEQILYTIDHAEDDIILIHEEFLPILDQIKGRIDTVTRYVVLRDDEECEYERLLEQESTEYNFLISMKTRWRQLSTPRVLQDFQKAFSSRIVNLFFILWAY